MPSSIRSWISGLRKSRAEFLIVWFCSAEMRCKIEFEHVWSFRAFSREMPCVRSTLEDVGGIVTWKGSRANRNPHKWSSRAFPMCAFVGQARQARCRRIVYAWACLTPYISTPSACPISQSCLASLVIGFMYLSMCSCLVTRMQSKIII
jgi:hypothetical protein